MAEKVRFKEIEIGGGFDPSYGHILENRFDTFSDRPWGAHIKISETESVWLRTGQKFNVMPDHLVTRLNLEINVKK